MSRRLATWLLERAFGPQRARSIVGDLEEDLAGGWRPRWASWAAGAWLLWQAIVHVALARWGAHRAENSPRDHSHISRELATMWQDVRYAVRRLRSTPTFTAIALLVLALTIGAGTAIFSIVDAVALRSLPYEEPDRLVQLGTVDLTTGSFGAYQPPQNFADWRARQTALAAMTATQPASGFSVDDNGVHRELQALQVTAGYFDVYRAHPQLGRPFTADDAAVGSPRVAVISDGLWRRQFAADPNVVGTALRSTAGSTYGAPFPVPAGTWTIVGVMPPGFQWPVSAAKQTDVWVPYVVPEDQRTREGSRSAPLQVTGRLADGVAVTDADAQIRAITSSLAEAHPAWFEGSRGGVRSLHEAVVGDSRAGMLLLLYAAGAVLLIACVNLANLMLARVTARSREIRTSQALGASRWRIARGLLVESVVLATAGMFFGIAIAAIGIDLLRGALPDALPRISTVGMNIRVFAASALVSLAAGLFFGVVPGLVLTRSGAMPLGRDGSRGATIGGTRLRSALVVAEMAMAVVLTTGAGLFLSSFVRVANVDLGLDPRHVLTMQVWPKFDRSQPGWADPIVARSATAIPEILSRIELIPSVVAAGFMDGDLPFTGYSRAAEASVPGREQPFAGDDRVQVRYVTPGYADAVGAEVVRGRYIETGDTLSAPRVVVLNEEAVARYFGAHEPLGAAITIERGVAPRATVIGIVRNVRLNGPESRLHPEAYLPVAQGRVIGGALAVRTTGEPLIVADAVREAIRASYPELAEPEANTMESVLSGLLAQRRFNMLLVVLFGMLALAIACAGLYGVISYLVAQQTREIGVRLALGASPTRVMRSVIGRGIVHTGAGLVAGLAVTWWLASFIEAFLFEVRPHDPVVYGGAAALLAGCAVVAAFVPARRAAGVNPVSALGVE